MAACGVNARSACAGEVKAGVIEYVDTVNSVVVRHVGATRDIECIAACCVVTNTYACLSVCVCSCKNIETVTLEGEGIAGVCDVALRVASIVAEANDIAFVD